MPGVTMVQRLLVAAEDLLNSGPRSAACRRRAVSTAYYAVFHALAKTCAETLLPNARQGSDEYRRVYRALDHAPLRNALNQPPATGHAVLKRIGPIILLLQNERHNADYLPPEKSLFPEADVRRLIAQARFVANEIESLDQSGQVLLVTCLLFKERRS